MSAIDIYLEQMALVGGSDLHLASGNIPMVRIHGELEQFDCPPLTAEQVRGIVLEVLPQREQELLFEHTNVDFVYETSTSRYRTNVFFQKNGLNIVLRCIPREIPSLAALGLPDALGLLAEFHQGLVLVTGPAGCGKTATLAALMNLVNERKAAHIITVEDPIEYLHPNKRSLVVQRQVGRHVDSFQTALRAALREDPDVIMVGEMRDLETIQLAITASETGHLVLGTLHTNGAIQTIDRIVDAFPAEQQSQIRTMLSESLRGIVSQQLIPRLDGKGRTVAYEMLLYTPSIANLIRDGKNIQITSMIQMGKNKGMQLMDVSLLELARQGLISPQEALDRALDVKTMEENLASSGGRA